MGNPIATVSVQVVDEAGQVSDDIDGWIQVELIGDGTAQLLGRLQEELADGEAQFEGLSIDRTGDYWLRVHGSNMSEAVSDSFKITPHCPTGLSAYWRLTQQDTNIFPDAVGDFPAVCQDDSCPSYWASEQALYFDGVDDGLEVAGDASAPFAWQAEESFTIEYWMKAGPQCCVDGTAVIVGRDDEGSAEHVLHWWTGCQEPDGDSGWILADADGLYAGLQGPPVNDALLWHHVVNIYDADLYRMRVVIDGELVGVASHSHGSLVQPEQNALTLGWMKLGQGYHYQGLLKQVALYERPLRYEEIGRHYRGGPGLDYCAVSIPLCGNQIQESGEECDDGNLQDLDGCSSTCTREIRHCPSSLIAYWDFRRSDLFTIDGYPSGLRSVCGRVLDGGELKLECPTPIENAHTFNGLTSGIDSWSGDFDWQVDDSFSLEIWMRGHPSITCPAGGVANNDVILGRDDENTSLHWWFGCSNGSGAAHFHLGDTLGNDRRITGAPIVDDNWHHVVGVYDAAQTMILLYVDGELSAYDNTAYQTGFGSATAPINLGWLNLSGGYHFQGDLTLAAIYSDALSASTVASHFEARETADLCATPD